MGTWKVRHFICKNKQRNYVIFIQPPLTTSVSRDELETISGDCSYASFHQNHHLNNVYSCFPHPKSCYFLFSLTVALHKSNFQRKTSSSTIEIKKKTVSKNVNASNHVTTKRSIRSKSVSHPERTKQIQQVLVNLYEIWQTSLPGFILTLVLVWASRWGHWVLEILDAYPRHAAIARLPEVGDRWNEMQFGTDEVATDSLEKIEGGREGGRGRG